MTIPAWPSDLPQRALANGYSEKLRDGRLFSRMSAGPPKVRRRFSAAILQVRLSFRLSVAQKSIFEEFFYDATKGGALPFTMPDQTHDGLPLLDGAGVPILDGDGKPILVSASWLCLFGEDAPALTPYGISFLASFDLSVLP